MSTEEPQGVIRRYLDQHGGSVEVPAHNLLSTWEVQNFEGGNRERIAQALRDAGVQTEPPLHEVDRDTTVTLRVRDEPVSAPPWGAPQEAAPKEAASRETADVTAPRQEARAASTEAPAARPSAKPPPRAGWYLNPQGPGRRYWDGRQWTDRYSYWGTTGSGEGKAPGLRDSDG